VIQVDFSLLLQIINFLILIVVLNVLLYKPLLAIIDKRTARIADGQEEINRLNRLVEEKMAAYEEKVRATKIEALANNKLLITEGSDQAKAIMEDAAKDVFASSTQYHDKLHAEVLAAREMLRGHSARISLEIAEKVLGRRLQ
jgi:F-type H+-transporting ATPase subunit b